MIPNHAIRQHKRQQRRNLSRRSVLALSQLACRQASTLLNPRIKRVAIYLPTANELDTWPLIEYCWRQKILVYVPITQALNHQMQFCLLRPSSHLIRGRYGILRPAKGSRLSPKQLQRVFAPLVAFDRHGARLGMGAGFYDRKMAFKRTTNKPTRSKPPYIGLAYAFQESETAIQQQAWDIPLDLAVTESGVLRVKPSCKPSDADYAR